MYLFFKINFQKKEMKVKVKVFYLSKGILNCYILFINRNMVYVGNNIVWYVKI